MGYFVLQVEREVLILISTQVCKLWMFALELVRGKGWRKHRRSYSLREICVLGFSPPVLTATQLFSISPQLLEALSPTWFVAATSPSISKNPGVVFVQNTSRYLNSPLVAHCQSKLAWASAASGPNCPTEMPIRLELDHHCQCLFLAAVELEIIPWGWRKWSFPTILQVKDWEKKTACCISIYLEKHLEAKLIGLQSSST